jgi:hypothetical protein
MLHYQRMRFLRIIGILLLIAAAFGLGAVLGPSLRTTKAPGAAVQPPVAEMPKRAVFVPAEPAATSTGEAVPGAAGPEAPLVNVSHEEQTVAEPIPYLPPPTIDLTGRTLGRQRVPGLEAIGDIHKLYWYDPEQALFMAVTEKDGMRSVWRLAQTGKAERVFVADILPGEIRVDGDSRGRIYVQVDNPPRVYRSDDGLRSWRLVFKDYGLFWQIADDGNGTLYGALHSWNRPVLYRSADDGFTWEPWKDFSVIFPEYAVRYSQDDDRFKMRHLHGVIYDRTKSRLIVGTGDVARFALMSYDDGATWLKVWDEGFTASVRMSGGFRYLLGPDQLHGHGIGLYDLEADAVREVWNPIPHGYAGYVYSMLNVGGTYYAAIHTEANEVGEVVPKFGIIVSPDGETWYPFLEWGPLERHARTNVWLANSPSTVYASVNGTLYAFRPVDKAWFASHRPFP